MKTHNASDDTIDFKFEEVPLSGLQDILSQYENTIYYMMGTSYLSYDKGFEPIINIGFYGRPSSLETHNISRYEVIIIDESSGKKDKDKLNKFLTDSRWMMMLSSPLICEKRTIFIFGILMINDEINKKEYENKKAKRKERHIKEEEI